MKLIRRRIHKRRNNKHNIYVLIAVTAGIIGGTVGMTLAFLSYRSGLTNEFSVGEVQAEVQEIFENNIKQDVSVKNTGTVPSYIRAAVTISWQDENGNISWGTPAENTDYIMELNLATDGAGWVQGADGYYYYTEPVETQQATDILVKTCREENIDSHKQEGKFLVVDIAAQAIQAEPEDAVLEAWNAAVTDVNADTGILTVDTSGVVQGGGSEG